MQKVKGSKIEFTPEQIQLIKTQIAPKATDDELKLFLYQAQRTGLDPLARQIYCIHRKSQGVEKMTIQTSIDGFRVIAERTGDYGGQSAPIFEEFNGMPTKCTISVFRFRGETRYEASIAVAFFNEYVQLKDEYANNQRTGRKVPADMWAKMPHTMLAKVTEALALRKAYPQDLSGLYTTDEMAQSTNDEEAAAPQQQLPQGTSVPFTPPMGQAQAQAQPAPQQQSAPQQQNQQQAPPQTPFTKKYNSVDTILAVVKTAAKVDELSQIYFANTEFIEQNAAIKDAISAKRDIIKNQGKVIITNSQFTQVCDRIRKGDANVLQNAINAYILNDGQKEELQQLDKLRMQLEEALTLKYSNPSDIATLIEQCTTPEYITRLHRNNSMIIDRDPELTNKINGKLRTFKTAA